MRLWDAGDSLSDILAEAGLGRVVMPYIPTGWTRDALIPELSPLLEQGDTVVLLDDLNRATWPFAKAGFFGVKKKIESLLGEVGIVGSGLDGAG